MRYHEWILQEYKKEHTMLTKLRQGVKVHLLVSSMNIETREASKASPKKSVILEVQVLPKNITAIKLYGFGNMVFKSVPGVKDTFMSHVDPRNPSNVLQIKIMSYHSE